MNIIHSNLVPEDFESGLEKAVFDRPVNEVIYLMGRLASDLNTTVFLQARYNMDDELISRNTYNYLRDMLETILFDMTVIIERCNLLITSHSMNDLRPEDRERIKSSIKDFESIVNDQKHTYHV